MASARTAWWPAGWGGRAAIPGLLMGGGDRPAGVRSAWRAGLRRVPALGTAPGRMLCGTRSPRCGREGCAGAALASAAGALGLRWPRVLSCQPGVCLHLQEAESGRGAPGVTRYRHPVPSPGTVRRPSSLSVSSVSDLCGAP